jgi:hypothetical protein
MGMKSFQEKNLGSRIMDAAVLAVSYLLFALITGFLSHPDFLPALLLHVTVLYTGLRLGKQLVFQQLDLPSRMAAVLSGNLLGLFVGNLVLAALLPVFWLHSSFIVLNLIASGAAFFVLGTLSPIIKDTRSGEYIAH